MDTIEQHVVKIVAEVFTVNESLVTTSSRFYEDLGGDELSKVELLALLQDKYGVDIPDDETDNLRSVHDIIDYIKRAQHGP
ncbi:acyl carrier protein [Nocardia sp. NPDC052566]|uniref:acyl carrier protein n=1 Tax=Nocardia sp. NPDC052566 TaxID=3364330 RepID=UPI0037C5F433